MGFRKNWDKQQIISQLATMSREMSSPYNDGFVGWGIKQELYEIKWYLDRVMANASEYSPEAEFVKQHEQQELVKILKDEV